MPLALWESRDEVHGHLGEWWVVVGYHDFVQGGLGSVCEIFVLLTGRASFYVLLNPGPSPRPAETVQDFPSGLIPSWVSRQTVVVGVHDASVDSLIWWDDRLLVLVHPQSLVVLPPLRFLPSVKPRLVVSTRLC